jgi:hypothetical protein
LGKGVGSVVAFGDMASSIFPNCDALFIVVFAAAERKQEKKKFHHGGHGGKTREKLSFSSPRALRPPR